MADAIPIPWSAWNDDTSLELSLHGPQVELLQPNDAAAWSADQIRDAVTSPIGSPPIRELAKGRQSVCIAVDDLARPTRASDILPIVLDELEFAGIAPMQCDVVVATGTHGAMTESQITLKIGEDALRRGVNVVVHNQERLQPTGIIYGKDELLLNPEFANADLKLGISSVLPHSFAGFSGGAKMMLPGLANVAATARSHKFVQMGLRGGQNLDQNRFRLEIEDLARQLEFTFTICVITNQQRRTAGVFAGDIVEAHRRACQEAQDVYETPCEGTFDALILNAYPKDGDLIQAENSFIAMKQSGFDVLEASGLVVLATAAKELGSHGLFSPGGVSYRAPKPNRALKGRDLWIFAPHLEEEIVRQRYWEEYRHFSNQHSFEKALEDRLGPSGRLGILPCSPMQQLVTGESQ